MEPTLTIDARGLLCPLPVLKLQKRLKALESGNILELIADDPAAVIDVPHYCNESGNELVKTEERAGSNAYFVRKTA
ncbi:sulfurtransferase TusA family protein [Roseovarius sp. EL26]|uniref:sulfurtransferase TusA family protein n=1 Tax=Roseovarius sp. EL26 TaxID=2126672 RepID=UPI000EA3B748|nr:sulfurtransferase TusA family protein [Roseovarius sp. EL26]